MGSVIKAISDWTTALTVPATTKATGPSFPNVGSLLQLNLDPKGLDKIYENHVWVYSCISRIADAIGSLPLIYEKKKGKVWEAVEDPKLESVLTYPSKQVNTPAQLWQLSEIHFDSAGQVFWVKTGVTQYGDIPENIVVVNPDRMSPITADNGWLLGWKYTNGNVTQTLMDYEVVWFNHPHPSKPWSGLSPMEAAAKGITIDQSAEEYSESFFKNAGIVSGVLEFREEADKKVLRQYKRQFQQEHGGAENAYKVLVTELGTKFTNISTSQKDMDFISQREWSRDEIIAVFRCNKHILGLTDSYNKATAMEAEKSFYTHAIIPRATTFQQVLWGQWLRWRREQTRVRFDFTQIDALKKDLAEHSLVIGRLMQACVPLVEINRIMNLGLDLEGNPHAETIWVRQGLVEADLQTVKGKEDMAALGVDVGGGGGGAEKALEAPTTSKLITKAEDPEDLIKLPATLFNEAAAYEALKKALEPLMHEAVDMALAQLETEGMAIGFDWEVSKAYSDFFKTKWNRVKTIPVRYHRTMKKVISDAIERGDTVGDIAKLLDERFKDQGAAQSWTIARTETGDTIDNSRYMAMEEEDVPYHAWTSAHDPAVRDSHREGDWAKTWVKVGNLFPNGLKNPHDPNGGASEVINCRCTTFPLMDKPEGKIDTTGQWDARIKVTSTTIEKKAAKAVHAVYAKLQTEMKANIRKAN